MASSLGVGKFSSAHSTIVTTMMIPDTFFRNALQESHTAMTTVRKLGSR